MCGSNVDGFTQNKRLLTINLQASIKSGFLVKFQWLIDFSLLIMSKVGIESDLAQDFVEDAVTEDFHDEINSADENSDDEIPELDDGTGPVKFTCKVGDAVLPDEDVVDIIEEYYSKIDALDVDIESSCDDNIAETDAGAVLTEYISRVKILNEVATVEDIAQVEVVSRDYTSNVGSLGDADGYSCKTAAALNADDATNEDVSSEDVSDEDAHHHHHHHPQQQQQKKKRRKKRKPKKDHETKSEKADRLIEESLSAIPVPGLVYPIRSPQQKEQNALKSKGKFAGVKRKLKKTFKSFKKTAARGAKKVKSGLKKTYNKMKRRRKKPKKHSPQQQTVATEEDDAANLNEDANWVLEQVSRRAERPKKHRVPREFTARQQPQEQAEDAEC